MHNNDDNPLKRLQQLLATAPCAFEFFSRSAAPTDLLTRIADELEVS